MKKKCPCCSGSEYELCCEPFHKGQLPKHALQLMRSRYSAYALDLPDYIMSTTHPKNSQYSENKPLWKLHITYFSQNTAFHKLDILDVKENENTATVTFTAHLSQNSQDASFTEMSNFEKINNQWLYTGRDPSLGQEGNK